MTVRRLALVLAVGLLGVASVAGQAKVSELPVPEPYKDKRIVPSSSRAVEPEHVPYEGIGEAYGDPLDGPGAYGGYPVPLDSAALAVRPVPRDALQRFRDDPAYAYAEAGPRARGPSLGQRIWDWIVRNLFEPLSEAAPARFWDVFWGLLAVAVLLFFGSKLFGAEVGRLFRRRDDGPGGAAAGPLLDVEDIEAVDLERLLDRALAEGHHREAVRFRYLRVLQRLAAEGVVVWQKHKTNRDYQAEVQRSGRADLAHPFGEVTRLFAWVWYGEAPVEAARYARMAASFDRVEATLRGAGEGVAR